jgi:hypothetical protein
MFDVLKIVLRRLHNECASVHITVKHLIRLASGQRVGFVVDRAALGQVFSEYFGFRCQPFHQFLRHHNHPELAQ